MVDLSKKEMDCTQTHMNKAFQFCGVMVNIFSFSASLDILVNKKN